MQNKLFNKLSNKKNKLFDVSTYCDLLKCNINSNECKNISKKDNIENGGKVMEKTIEIKKEKNLVKENKIISVQGKKVNTKGNTKENIQNNIANTSKSVKTILIKDVFNDELTEIGKYIYAQMSNEKRRKDAIKAWDNLEDLSYKKITNKEAVQKMVHLIKIHSSYCNDITLNEKKYTKYL